MPGQKIDAHTVKHLELELSRLRHNIEKQKEEMRRLQKGLSDMEHLRGGLEQKLKSATKDKVVMTEHALIRYIERVMLVDVTQICQTVENSLHKVWLELGDGEYPLTEDHMVRIVNGKIITVLHKHKPEVE